eukprot:TRINITY_DN6082_c0_g1_i1.p1 TRINITY_DN6082_c0_g1~~TRINITY_DN6082_c0_g1_i1.p1  ORF type:complete len:217 (+),score=38.07 TRINITY_DN6082_c0_g1_i1:174-824(+)
MECTKPTKDPITFQQLIEGLLEFFSEGKENVDIDEVIEFFNRYENNPEDWKSFAKWDKFKYTRNLIHEGNGNFNLILMCWPEGAMSAIHDHSDSHCFMRVLDGEVKEIRYHWPEDVSSPDGSLQESSVSAMGAGSTLYMSDDLGIHKVENASHTDKLVSLHLYSPPFDFCKVFDERTSKRTRINMCFYSKFGEKQDVRKCRPPSQATSSSFTFTCK